MENSSPITIHQKVEYINHIDTAEIINRLKRIEQKVERDTAGELALARENEELHVQLNDLLSGETLPPVVQEKYNALFKKLTDNAFKLKKNVENNTLPS